MHEQSKYPNDIYKTNAVIFLTKQPSRYSATEW